MLKNYRTAYSIAFEERFGIRPIEGYGVTECAPVIAVNCPRLSCGRDFFSLRRGEARWGSLFLGWLFGLSILIPMNDYQIGTSGMLLVKGPNLMDGYLGREDLTAQVMHEGWYITGDIAKLDEDGFLTITDRLSRFSKIGGEMIPHGRVEEAFHQA